MRGAVNDADDFFRENAGYMVAFSAGIVCSCVCFFAYSRSRSYAWAVEYDRNRLEISRIELNRALEFQRQGILEVTAESLPRQVDSDVVVSVNASVVSCVELSAESVVSSIDGVEDRRNSDGEEVRTSTSSTSFRIAEDSSTRGQESRESDLEMGSESSDEEKEDPNAFTDRILNGLGYFLS